MRMFSLFFIAIILFSPVSKAIGMNSGDKAPDFTLGTIDGNIEALSEYEGKVVVLLYWRTGQKRSLKALKDNKSILKEFKGKEIKVITVIADSDSQDEVKKILSENEIEFSVVVDSGRQLYSNYGVRVYPTTLIIDGEGLLSHSIPSHPLSYKKLLKVHLQKALGEIDERELEEALSPGKGKKDKSTLEALRSYNLALKFVKSGMTDIAIMTVKKSIKADPEMAKSHILLGFLYLEEKESDLAEEAFNRAMELDPRSNDAKTGLGGALILKGEIDRAIEILTPAAIANPYPQMTYYELGKAYEIQGEKDRSIEMYKKAIEKIIHKQILPSSISKCK